MLNKEIVQKREDEDKKKQEIIDWLNEENIKMYFDSKIEYENDKGELKNGITGNKEEQRVFVNEIGKLYVKRKAGGHILVDINNIKK